MCRFVTVSEGGMHKLRTVSAVLPNRFLQRTQSNGRAGDLFNTANSLLMQRIVRYTSASPDLNVV